MSALKALKRALWILVDVFVFDDGALRRRRRRFVELRQPVFRPEPPLVLRLRPACGLRRPGRRRLALLGAFSRESAAKKTTDWTQSLPPRHTSTHQERLVSLPANTRTTPKLSISTLPCSLIISSAWSRARKRPVIEGCVPRSGRGRSCFLRWLRAPAEKYQVLCVETRKTHEYQF